VIYAESTTFQCRLLQISALRRVTPKLQKNYFAWFATVSPTSSHAWNRSRQGGGSMYGFPLLPTRNYRTPSTAHGCQERHDFRQKVCCEPRFRTHRGSPLSDLDARTTELRQPFCGSKSEWCGREDSNLHGCPQRPQRCASTRRG
jgi:hypothetical protein